MGGAKFPPKTVSPRGGRTWVTAGDGLSSRTVILIQMEQGKITNYTGERECE